MKLSRPTRIVTLAAFLFLSLAAGSDAQQLWSIKEVVTQPAPRPSFLEGVVVSAATTGAPAAEVATVEVAYDYLRVGMGYLELPLRDGSVIEAENAVFEDRGAGNLMWTGEIQGTGYENVLFTVQDGHLVGWFGKPGGPNYVIHAGPDGRGTLAVEPNLTGDWCGTDHAQHAVPGLSVSAPPQPSGRTGHHTASANVPRTKISAANESHRLDILTVYPRQMEVTWNMTVGGVSVGIQSLSDYLNLVFRNNRLSFSANLIPYFWDSGIPPAISNQGGHYYHPGLELSWNSLYLSMPGVTTLMERNEADLIHFITPFTNVWSGAAPVDNRYGWSGYIASTFVHEIGHNLGAWHNPETIPDFSTHQREVRSPYGHGYTEEQGVPGCIMTTMSLSLRSCSGIPFFSSVARKPEGRTIGIAGTSEVERLFREGGLSNLPRLNSSILIPQSVSIEWKDPDTLIIASPILYDLEKDDRGIRVLSRELYSLNLLDVHGRGHRGVLFEWDENGDIYESALEGRDVRLFAGDGVATRRRDDVTQVEFSGLQPGGRYRVFASIRESRLSGEYVKGIYRFYSYTIDYSLPLAMGESPTPRVGALAAPARLSAEMTESNSVRLSWWDDSDASLKNHYYSIFWRKFSGEGHGWKHYGEPLSASTRYAFIGGLVAEDRRQTTAARDSNRLSAIGRYSFVVVAHDRDGAYAPSDVLDFEFMPGPYPEPTTRGEFTECVVRPSGVVLNDWWHVDVCFETPDGAPRRAWSRRLESDQAGLLWFFERDNAEILVKAIDGCAINGHWWVFVAPVTDLPFRLRIRSNDWRHSWYYDSQRRPPYRFRWEGGNKKGLTAQTVSDTTAFRCTPAEVAAAARSAVGGPGEEPRAAGSWRSTFGVTASTSPLAMGAHTDCEPGGTVLELLGGYTVSMCYETSAGAVGNARDFGLDSSQSGLLYFFERDNVEVLIKVLDGCGVNGHRWVFVAPVTELAFNLQVTGPDGEVWTHTNRLGQTADAASDTAAFPCKSA